MTFAVNIAFSDNEEEKEISQEFIDKVNAMIEESFDDLKNGRYRDGFEVMKDFLKKYALV